MRMTVIFASGKTLTYEKDLIDIMVLKARFLENEERRCKLGMTVDKIINIKVDN